MTCQLCLQSVMPIYADDKLAVILVDDAAYPGFCRVIWNEHVKEMSDLAPADRMKLNDAVWHVELALRDIMAPGKINVASLGNMVPHLHWHVIPRFADDSHFPQPVWAPRQRPAPGDAIEERRSRLDPLRRRIAEEVSRVPRS